MCHSDSEPDEAEEVVDPADAAEFVAALQSSTQVRVTESDNVVDESGHQLSAGTLTGRLNVLGESAAPRGLVQMNNFVDEEDTDDVEGFIDDIECVEEPIRAPVAIIEDDATAAQEEDCVHPFTICDD